MLFEVGVSCRILYSLVSYLYVSCSGSVTSVGKERANLSDICSERFPLPLGALGRLGYFIVALPRPSIYYYIVRHLGNQLVNADVKLVQAPHHSTFILLTVPRRTPY